MFESLNVQIFIHQQSAIYIFDKALFVNMYLFLKRLPLFLLARKTLYTLWEVLVGSRNAYEVDFTI